MAEVSIIYLVWLPAGVEAVSRFLASYAACPGGMPHDLAVVYKGYTDRGEMAPFEALFRDVPHHPIYMPHSYQDIDAYFEAAAELSHTYVCCLNTSSAPQDAEWLRKLYAHGTASDVGVAGATGSWQGRLYSMPRQADYSHFRHYVSGVVKTRLINTHLLPFPNPHVRSNAFLIRRDRLLSLKGGAVRSKDDAMRFEHGKQSMTRQLQRQGLKTLIVGRDASVYDVQDWPRSGIYCQEAQGNLLVADNRTRLYQDADAATRQEMSRLAWGEPH